MKRLLLLAEAVLIVAAWARADEIKVQSRIESVGLFKNGLAVVERSLQVAGPGVYRLEDVPSPVHGTFWAQGDGPVEVRETMDEVAAPPRRESTVDLQQELVGQEVTIHFREGAIPPVTGKVVKLEKPHGEQGWTRDYQPGYAYGYGNGPQESRGQFLVLDTGQGLAYADSAMIACVQSKGSSVRQRQPVLLLTVGADQKGPGAVHISYLTRGLAWAPSYRVSLIDEKSLVLEQQAVIKNELEDLSDCDVRLISGFPSIQCAHVVSPLSLSQSWAQFFAQLSQNPMQNGGAMANAMAQASQNVAPSDAGPDISALPTGDGVDVHYQPIGKKTLREGDSLSVPVAGGKAEYERIVEWVVPDTRDVDGRFSEEYRRNQEPDKSQDAAWDAVRFKNPLPFAMTTAPAMILDSGRFAGQRMSFWVNSGEQTTLQITKALSLRTRAVEQEDPADERQVVWVGGWQFRKVTVKGELAVSNHRAKDINLVIRQQFSGDLVKADGDPKLLLREEGAYSVNRRNELIWTLPIKSGEEKTLKYEYTLLARN